VLATNSDGARALLIATRNGHKVQEIRAMLSGPFRYLTLDDFPGAPVAVEDADTFAANATRKAVELARWLAQLPNRPSARQGLPKWVLADDSGLEVDALGGSPGVRSARFAALDLGQRSSSEADRENSPDTANNEKLLRLLAGVPREKRAARFRCALALVEITPRAGSGSPQLFEGACEGRIGLAPSGQGGFGYDPLFTPLGHDRSFAELGEEVKNKLSHRAQALAKLRAYLIRASL
jgi:XTP/dITP diphosphohydrolase